MVCLALLVAGCEAPRYRIAFDSEPAGALVFYTAGATERSAAPPEYVGVTPCVWEIEGNGDRTFKGPRIPLMSEFVKPAVVFTAKPSSDGTNLFEQRVVYHSGAIAQPADKIPAKIFFDLRKSKVD